MKSRKEIFIIIIALIMVLFFNRLVYANDEKEENYSDAYKRYLQLSNDEKAKLNVIPRKYKVPLDVLYENNEKPNVLLKSNSKAQGVKGVNPTEEELPSSYILTKEDTNNDGVANEKDIKVERYGGIKIKTENQDQYGLCWAFASINTLETNLALHGYEEYDFSELHLDYMRSVEENDDDIKDFYYELHGGGAFYVFENYLKSKEGVVLESEVPYSNTYDEPEQLNYLLSLKQRADCKEFVDMPTVDKFSNTYTDEELRIFRNAVKRHIIENGALYASINYEDIIENNNICVLNSKAPDFDHSITIIGWDDNFSKENFPENCKPKSNGAYIALNSWGDEWGHNGIFYISYEDSLVEAEMQGVKDGYIVDPFFISIEHEPTKVNYIEGEKFDASGLIINANYQNGTFKQVTNYKISPEVLSIGDKEVTIMYQEGETVQEVKQKIRVYSSKYKCGENSYAYYNEKTKNLNIEGTGEIYNYSNAEENPFSNLEIERIIINENIDKVNSFCSIANLKELYILGNCNINDLVLNVNQAKIYVKKGSNVIDQSVQNNIKYVEYDTYYKCGDNSYAFLNNTTGELNIVGIGDTYDFLISELPWKESVKNIEYASIGDNITKIGKQLFTNAINLKRVKIGKDILSIGDYSFYNNKELQEIVLNKNVISIGRQAFYNCKALKEIKLPDTIQEIGAYAFYQCTSLKEIFLPGTVENIKEYSFSYCTDLEKLEMEDGIKYIYKSAFDHCEQLKEIIFPQTLVYIDGYGFNHCINLENVNLPYGINQLSFDAFSECIKIKEFVIPNSVTSYGNCIFREDTFLKKIKLSNNASIPDGLWQHCINLKEIVVPYGVKEFGGDNFYECNSLEKIRFSNSVEKIGNYNYQGCNNLKSIIIPEKVTSIGDEQLSSNTTIYCKENSYAQKWANQNEFNYIIDNKAPTIRNVQVEKTQLGAKKVIVTAEDDNETVGIDVYSFDGGVTWQEEPYKCFTNSGKLEIIVKDGVGNISESQSLQIKVDEKMIDLSIEKDASIIGKLEEDNKLVIYGEGDIINCDKKEIDELMENSGLDLDNIKYIEIKEGITSIGKFAFSTLDNIEKILIPKSVNRIGMSILYGNYGIKEISLPNYLSVIDNYAFAGLTANIYYLSGTKTEKTVDRLQNKAGFNRVSIEVENKQMYNEELKYTIMINDEPIDLASAISAGELTITGYDSKLLGEQNVVIKYKDLEAMTFNINVELRKYTVTFVDEDKTELQSGQYEYGTSPQYKGELPKKEKTAQYTYTFAGWTPKIEEVTENVTYTATYTQKKNKYTVTWKNEDGTELEKDEEVPYGEMPSYDGEIPTKTSTGQYTYIFAGWTPKIEEVTGNVTYTATYTENVIPEGYNIEQEGKISYLTGINPNTVISDFLKSFRKGLNVSIIKNGETIREGKMGTGMSVQIKENENVKEDCLAIVIGDCNGDGEANIKDMVKINNYRLYGTTTNFDEIYRKAADVNKDRKIDIKDMVRINNYRLYGTNF